MVFKLCGWTEQSPRVGPCLVTSLGMTTYPNPRQMRLPEAVPRKAQMFPTEMPDMISTQPESSLQTVSSLKYYKYGQLSCRVPHRSSMDMRSWDRAHSELYPHHGLASLPPQGCTSQPPEEYKLKTSNGDNVEISCKHTCCSHLSLC